VLVSGDASTGTRGVIGRRKSAKLTAPIASFEVGPRERSLDSGRCRHPIGGVRRRDPQSGPRGEQAQRVRPLPWHGEV